VTVDTESVVDRFPFVRFQQTTITSRGVLRVFDEGRPEGRHADVNCPWCGSNRVERFMRVSVYANDPMLCGACRKCFLASDIPGMWR